MLQYLKLAAEVANLSADTHRKACVGAVAIRRDGVIVVSRNAGIQFPNGKFPKSHAESRVMRKAGYGATVYVSRIMRQGSLAIAKPCQHCHRLLKSRGVEAVYYTVSNTVWEGYKF